MRRVLCNATVDHTDENIVVTVVGSGDDTGKTSSYLFPLDETEDSAAMEAIRRFVAENGGQQ